MQHKNIRLGYCPSRRTIFSKTEARKYRDMIKDVIRAFPVDIVDIDDINEEGLLYTSRDVESVVAKFRREGIDALFLPLCNFGEEEPLCEVARQFKGLPVLLYGPRDDAPDERGMRMRDTQCGLFAAGKVLNRSHVTFTYLTNTDPNGAYFKKGFDRFLRVANTVRAVQNLRVLQLGPRPAPFMSVMVDEGGLLEQFGVEIIPIDIVSLTDTAEKIREERGEAFEAQAAGISGQFTIQHADPRQAAEKVAALKLAIRRYADRYHAGCAAIQCWPTLQRCAAMFPCAVNGLLSEEGFPVACETDIHGAISAVLLQAAMGDTTPHFFADITIRHPEDDNTELLWHCGPFPPSLAKSGAEKKLTDHWNGGTEPGDLAYPLKDGALTLCRFDGQDGAYKLFIGEGVTTDGPRTVGTYVYIKVNDWPKWEHKLVKGPYIHHVAGVYGRCGEVLSEACRYIPGLEADPCEPEAEALEARWRG